MDTFDESRRPESGQQNAFTAHLDGRNDIAECVAFSDAASSAGETVATTLSVETVRPGYASGNPLFGEKAASMESTITNTGNPMVDTDADYLNGKSATELITDTEIGTNAVGASGDAPPAGVSCKRKESTSERTRERLRVTFSDECADVTTPLTSPPPYAAVRAYFAVPKEPHASDEQNPHAKSSYTAEMRQENGYRLPRSPAVSSNNAINPTLLPPASANIEPEEDAEELARMRQNFCPVPGKKYLVHMRSGEQHVAELLSKRVRHANTTGGSLTSTTAVMLDGNNSALPGEVDTDNSNVEYFVHFEGFNRRLDEWVTIDRIHPRELDQNQLSAKADENDARKRTRSQKRRHDEINHIAPTLAEIDPSQAALEKLHEEVTKIKYIDRIVFGPYEIDTWYYSPYPGEYRQRPVLYICEYCMKYMMHRPTWEQHKRECIFRQPPGREIYRKGQLSVYEADGSRHKVYCQCLCLLAKLFLDHKTLYFDVEPFWFYILTEYDQQGAHVVGYFSKEKESADGNNVACILTFPPFQRKGYGKFLIDLSYELSRREHKVGSPEKPLSDMGKLSYRSYWAYSILSYLKNIKDRDLSNLSIRDLSIEIGFHCSDIINTLQPLNLVRYWRSHYVLTCKHDVICEYLEKSSFRPPRLTVDKACLRWMPHLPVAPRSIERITMLKAALGEQHLLELMNHMTLLKTGVAPPQIVTNPTSSPKLTPSALVASPPQTQAVNGGAVSAETSSIAATAATVLQQLHRRMSSNKPLDKALTVVFETWQQACENVRRSRENGNLHQPQLGLGTAQPEADVYNANGGGAEFDGGSVDGSITSSSGGSGSSANSAGYNPHRVKPAALYHNNNNNSANAAHTSTLSQTAADTLAATRSRRILKPSAVVRDNAAASGGGNGKPRGRKPGQMVLLQQQRGRKRTRNVSNDSMGSSQGVSESDEDMPEAKMEDVNEPAAHAVVVGGIEGRRTDADDDDDAAEEIVKSFSSTDTVENEVEADDNDHTNDRDYTNEDAVSQQLTKHSEPVLAADSYKRLDAAVKLEESGSLRSSRKHSPRRSARLVSTGETDIAGANRNSVPISPGISYADGPADISIAASTSNEQRSLNDGDDNDGEPIVITLRNGRQTTAARAKNGKFVPLKTILDGDVLETDTFAGGKNAGRKRSFKGSESELDAAAASSTLTKSGRKKSKYFDDDGNALVVQSTSSVNADGGSESAMTHDLPRKRVVKLLSKPRPTQAVDLPFSGTVFEDFAPTCSAAMHMSMVTSILPPLTSITQIVEGADDDNWNKIISAPTASVSRASSSSVAVSSSVISGGINENNAKTDFSSSSSSVANVPSSTRTVTLVEPKLHLPATSSFATSTITTSSSITRSSLRRSSASSGTNTVGSEVAIAQNKSASKKSTSSRRDSPLKLMTRSLRSSTSQQQNTVIDESVEDETGSIGMSTRRRKSLTATPHVDSTRQSAALSASASSTDLSVDDSSSSGTRKLKHVTLINPDALDASYKSPSSSAVMSPAASASFQVFSPSARNATTAATTSSFFAAAEDPYVISEQGDGRLPVLYAADAEIGMNAASAAVGNESWPSHFDAGSPPIIVASRAADCITMPQICNANRNFDFSHHQRSSVDRSGADVAHMNTSGTDIASKSILMNILDGDGDGDEADDFNTDAARPAAAAGHADSGRDIYASSSFESSANDDGGEDEDGASSSFVSASGRKSGKKKGRPSSNKKKPKDAGENRLDRRYHLTEEEREKKRSRAVSMQRNTQGRFVRIDSTTTSSANSESGAPPVNIPVVVVDIVQGDPIGLGGIRTEGTIRPGSGSSRKKTLLPDNVKKTPAKAHGKKSGTPTSSASGNRRAPSSSSTSGMRRSGGSERESLRSSPSPPSVTDQLTIERLNAVDAVTASRARDRPMRASAKGALLSFVTRDL